MLPLYRRINKDAPHLRILIYTGKQRCAGKQCCMGAAVKPQCCAASRRTSLVFLASLLHERMPVLLQLDAWCR